jgi:hypothetical protein
LEEALDPSLLCLKPLREVVHERVGLAARRSEALVRRLLGPVVLLQAVQHLTNSMQSSLDLGTAGKIVKDRQAQCALKIRVRNALVAR